MSMNHEILYESNYPDNSIEELKANIAEENLMVLVVEDDPMNRIFMGKNPASSGCESRFCERRTGSGAQVYEGRI